MGNFSVHCFIKHSSNGTWGEISGSVDNVLYEHFWWKRPDSRLLHNARGSLPVGKKNRGESAAVLLHTFFECFVCLMGPGVLFFPSPALLMSHFPSTLGVQGAAHLLLSRQPHTVALPMCPFVCLLMPACLFLFLWYFSEIQVLCRVRATFGSSLAAASAWLITERLHLTDKLPNLEAYVDAYINRFFFFVSCKFKELFFPMTRLLSNQHLIVSVPRVCSITLSQQTARSPPAARQCLMSNWFDFLSEGIEGAFLLLPPSLLKCGG